MANPKPDLYTVYVGAKRVSSPATERALTAALTIDITRTPPKGPPVPVQDPGHLVMRPGDSIQFEFGDIRLRARKPRMEIEWKPLTGKKWEEAPTAPGKPGLLPPKAGYACQLFRYCISVYLGLDAKLPLQQTDDAGNTIVTIDPDVGSDEC